ncbi:hypothetical protein EDS67_14115 [candidate division KSB1 bacterium]|nr:MAG: hypothetical protein EDS67_14115 [candidate division KSB1 bacterium]MBC6949430.1 hypothetical protein [candidate division KSB1 bacterium]MCE7941095.1 hypothetical protein [Chlorobi bacterium CHB1]MDL1876816.1 hypothetical protein [Cytophagia bacterium CHB2]
MSRLHDLSVTLTAALCLIYHIRFGASAQAQVPVPTVAPPDSAAITVAVLDFKNNSGQFNLDVLEKNVPEMLKTELSRAGSGIWVVERQKLEMVLQEQALAQTGLIDQKTAQEVGQLAGAQYLLNGEISLSGSRLRIDCHILKVENGKVRGEKVVGDRNASEDMVRMLASNILYNLTGEGQYRQSLRLKNYPTTWLALATALTAAAAGVTHAIHHQAYDNYQSANRLEDIDKYYSRAGDFRKVRNVTAIVSGALALTSLQLWLKNQSEQNRILAAAPEKSWRTQGLILFADDATIRLGVMLHF